MARYQLLCQFIHVATELFFTVPYQFKGRWQWWQSDLPGSIALQKENRHIVKATCNKPRKFALLTRSQWKKLYPSWLWKNDGNVVHYKGDNHCVSFWSQWISKFHFSKDNWQLSGLSEYDQQRPSEEKAIPATWKQTQISGPNIEKSM